MQASLCPQALQLITRIVCFSDLLEKRLVQALMFDNEWKIFPSVHPDTPFGIFVFGFTKEAPIFVRMPSVLSML